MLSPQGQVTPFGTAPRIVSYEVGAIFEVGVYDYDKAFVIMPMEQAQTLLMLGGAVGMIEVMTTDADNVRQILAPLADKVTGRAVVTDWQTMNASLFDALKVERAVMFWVLSIIRSEEHKSELQSLMRIEYAVFCLKKKRTTYNHYV